MERYNDVAIMDLKNGLEATKLGGVDTLVNQFLWAARANIDLQSIDLNNKTVLDVEQNLDILRVAGREAFAVHFLLEATDECFTISEVSSHLNISIETAKTACERLGLYMIRITDDPSEIR